MQMTAFEAQKLVGAGILLVIALTLIIRRSRQDVGWEPKKGQIPNWAHPERRWMNIREERSR